MSVEYITAPSVYSMLRSEVSLVDKAVDGKHAATLIVLDHELEEARKLMLADLCPMGVDVQTYAHWIGSMWDLYGDGRSLVTPEQRHVLLRPLLTELAGLEPSSDYVDMLARFAVDCIAVGAMEDDASNEMTRKLVRAVGVYAETVDALGLVEAAAVEQDLARHLAGRTIVFEEPALERARWRKVVEAFAEYADVHVLQLGIGDGKFADSANELTALRNRLFSGMQGLVPQGMLVAAEAYGAHAEPELVAGLIQRAQDAGFDTADIALALPDPAAAHPRMLDCLAAEGIPFECRFSLKARQTPFGEAFLALKHMRDPEFRDTYDEVATFVSSPYAGLFEDHARAFQAHWRALAGSTSQERLDDLRNGLAKRTPKSGWEPHLMRVVNLLDAKDLRTCAELMFANAQAAGVGPDRLKDDAAVCDAIIDHLLCCEELMAKPHDKDIAELQVPLVRTAGAADEAVRITVPGRISRAACVIMGRLDQESYPMALMPSPFDAALSEIGAPVELNQAQRCRVELLGAISSTIRLFIPYRLCHDIEGNEKCQSALWDELMNAYRREEDGHLAIQEVPSALVEGGFALRLSEEEAFHGSIQEQPGFEKRRGSIFGEEALAALMPDFELRAETFSPTALEDYHRCPYRWFISRRVGAKQLDGVFDQLAKGNLAHEMLRRVYAELAEAGIERVDESNLSQVLELANGACRNEIVYELDRDKLFIQTEREKEEVFEVIGQVLELLSRDSGFLPGFVPRYHELKLEGANREPLEYAGVKVKGKVDRIDVDKNGNAIVIDYKLSSLNNGYGFTADEDLPDRIQTDIYATLVQRHFEQRGEEIRVIGSVYRSYAINNLRGVYSQGINWGELEQYDDEADALPNGGWNMSYEEYLAKVEQEVAESMERLRAGDIAPNPRCDDACTYCLAESFCPERRG